MIETLLSLASTGAQHAPVNVTQAMQTVSIVLGILVTMGMMLIFVYKNRTLSLENQRNIARIESDYRERVQAMELSHKERFALLDAQQRIQDAELKRLEINLATLKAKLGEHA